MIYSLGSIGIVAEVIDGKIYDHESRSYLVMEDVEKNILNWSDSLELTEKQRIEYFFLLDLID